MQFYISKRVENRHTHAKLLTEIDTDTLIVCSNWSSLKRHRLLL